MDYAQVLEIYNNMTIERGGMASVWAEVLRFCYPGERYAYGEFGGNYNSPGKRPGTPVCSYPTTFAQRLGDAITESAFPSEDNWFDISIGVDEKENTDPTIREWCRKARDYTQFKMRQGSRFYQELGSMMHGLATLGTAGFYTYYKNGELQYRYVPIHKNLYIAKNSDGQIDMVAVLHEWTAKQAAEEYGRNNITKEMLFDLEHGKNETKLYSYVQLIYPKTPFGEPIGRDGKPYGDVTIALRDPNRIVVESSHKNFPFAIPRFYVYSDSLYGGSPAMVAMPIIKAANTLRRTVMDAGIRAIKPPLFITSMNNERISVEPGAINRIANLNSNSIWTYPAQANFQIGIEEAQQLIEELKHAFLIDIFQAIDQTDRMTATEVTERVRQKMQAIAPIVARIHKEFSDHVILQSLQLLLDAGEIDQPPVGAEREYWRIKYTSPLDASIAQGIASKTMTFVAQMGQIEQTLAAFPDASAIVNQDKILETLTDCAMLPHGYLRDPEEREQIRQQQAESQAQMQQAQQRALDSQSGLNEAKTSKLINDETYNGEH